MSRTVFHSFLKTVNCHRALIFFCYFFLFFFFLKVYLQEFCQSTDKTSVRTHERTLAHEAEEEHSCVRRVELLSPQHGRLDLAGESWNFKNIEGETNCLRTEF